MKTGITLQELAIQVADRSNSIRDFEASTRAMTMDATGDILELEGATIGTTRVRPNQLFHRQLADKVGIPQAYYNRMRETTEPLLRGLYQRNVNHWLENAPELRLVRTYAKKKDEGADGTNEGRAFLSDRYRPLDNYAMMGALLPPLMDTGLEVKSCAVTDERLYLQCVTPKITAELKVGQPVNMGLVVTNSETGCGALSIQVLIYVCSCTNGMVIPSDDAAFRKTHIGGRLFNESDRYLTAETRGLKDRATWAEARDVIKAAITESSLLRYVDIINGVSKVPLHKPAEAVDLIGKRYGIVQDEKNSIMHHLIAGGDPTQWGLIQAVTRTAQDALSYDRAFELEKIGGRMLALSPSDFSRN